MHETIFERATRHARERRERRKPGSPYKDVLVVHGAGSVRDARVRVGSGRLNDADLVIGVGFAADGTDPRGTVFKDRHGMGRNVREQDPCPCRNGRRFGTCHGR